MNENNKTKIKRSQSGQVLKRGWGELRGGAN